MLLTFFLYGDVIPLFRSYVDLAGAVELPLGIIDTFLPLADPPGKTANSEHDSEHVKGDTQRPQKDTAVKVQIWIQIVVYKVGIF